MKFLLIAALGLVATVDAARLNTSQMEVNDLDRRSRRSIKRMLKGKLIVEGAELLDHFADNSIE